VSVYLYKFVCAREVAHRAERQLISFVNTVDHLQQVNVCVYAYIFIYMCVCAYAYIYMYYVYIHIYMCVSKKQLSMQENISVSWSIQLLVYSM